MIARRSFLSGGALAAAALRLRAQTPGEIRSFNGLLDARLEASQNMVLLAGRSARLYTYNGGAQAPRLVANPGDTVRIALVNKLTESTNLHFHGFHVSPSGSADNVHRTVAPGATGYYDFQIPVDHPGGTFWYHPHIHPTTARQVWRGLAGVFVIRGALDALAPFNAMPERVLVLQDWRIDSYGSVVEPSGMERMQGREGNLITASGAVNPDLPIAANGWLRLRILNASASRYYRLSVEQHTMWRIATDGGAAPAPEPLSEILLTPGERVEVAIQGTRGTGVYRLLSLPYARSGSGGMMGGGMMRMGSTSTSTTLTLATLRYSGSAQPTGLPAKLAVIEPLPAPSATQTVTLGQGMHMTMTINGRTYDHHRVDFRARLGAVEDWEFVNPMSMDHPMHIHTNPFQVLDASGRPILAWKDVVNVKAGSRVKVRTQYRDFTGMAMLHCHILDHEDMGMMSNLEITS